ncbi:MAG: hypothetical protein II567_01790 [Candidatus Riflebacteria bacterium]|nr:hypothetical protein [Candidatus Riflebacteria bacterium]
MKKQGMAIPVVLVFAAIMGIVSSFLIRGAKQHNRQIQTSFTQLQSYFIARAGVEHAMLKIKYLHRELYDAICMSQGRNPLFDFSLIKSMNSPGDAIKPYNPGPVFLYKSGEFTPEVNTVFTKMDKKEGYDKWLRAFESDITSDSASNPNEEDNQKTNAFLDLGPNKSMDIKSQMKEPFKSAIYKLYDLNIAASEVKEIMEGTKDKVDNNVIVEFTVKSEILTAREETYNFEIKKTIRISRD